MRHPITVTATVTITEFKSGLGLGLGNGLSPSRPDTRDDMGGTKMWNFSRPRPQPATRKNRCCTTALVVCLQHYYRTSQHYLSWPLTPPTEKGRACSDASEWPWGTEPCFWMGGKTQTRAPTRARARMRNPSPLPLSLPLPNEPEPEPEPEPEMAAKWRPLGFHVSYFVC